MVVLSDSLLAPNSHLWLNHNSGASSFPKTEPSFSVSFCLAAARRKQTIMVSARASQETSCALFSYPSSSPPQSPVIITRHRALARPPVPPPFPVSTFTLSPSLPLIPMCVEKVSSSHRVWAHVSNQPLRVYELSKRIPYGQPLPFPFLTALTHSWPRIGDVGESTVPAAVGNNRLLEYIWDTGSHQPAHSQSLRLGNQGISGDSRLYFALLG